MPGSRRQKFSWAIRRKGVRVEEVEIFEKLVDQLDKLVPSQSTRPMDKPDPDRIDTFAQGMKLTKLKEAVV
jgi:hypothetical protein